MTLHRDPREKEVENVNGQERRRESRRKRADKIKARATEER